MKEQEIKEILRNKQALLSQTGGFCPDRTIRQTIALLKRRKRELSARALGGEAVSDGERWILENASLVSSILVSCLGETLPLSAHALFTLLCEECPRALAEEDLDAIFSFFAGTKQEHEVFVTAKESLLVAAAKVLCRRIRTGGDVSAPILTIRSLSRVNFSTYILAYSPLNALLLRDGAGVYPKMEYAFRARLWEDLSEAARRAGKSTLAYAEELLLRSEKTGEYVGAFLQEKRSFSGVLYSVFVCSFSFLASLLLFHRLCDLYPISTAFLLGFLLLSLPVSVSVAAVFDSIFSHFVEQRPLWRVQYETLPEERSTLVVIPALASKIEEVEELADSLKQAYFASFVPQKGEEHIKFGLLFDLPEAKTAETATDAPLLQKAREEIAKLEARYGESFYLFTRSRKPTGEGIWRPWERKRGALLSLVACLRGRESELSVDVGDKSYLTKIRYVLTLDSDTVLTPRAVQELVGIISHPKNSPRLSEKGGVPYVKKGYGILQPRIEPRPESAGKSPFSVLKSASGGLSAYERAYFERAQTLFSHGHFCGKGLFDVAAFDAVLSGAFPQNRILSHDLLEGARLSCASVGDVVLMDDVLSSASAESAREHRWCRGDVQALFFSAFRSEDAFGVLRKNPMPMYYRAALWDNLRRALVPVFSALLILLVPFAPPHVGTLFFSVALLPYLVPLASELVSLFVSLPKGGVILRFFSPVLHGAVQRLLLFLYEVSALFWEAKLHADAVLRALWRMLFSQKKTLEWKTASQSSRARTGLLSYLSTRAVCFLAGFFLLFFSRSSAVRLVAVFSILHPFLAWLLSRPYSRTSCLSKSDVQELSRAVRAASGFFLNEVGEGTHHLPPDHLTLSPVRIRAMRTSPTNIGMYLASLCAMADFDVLSVQEVLSRVSNCVFTLERLPKWHGLLYNWYDLETLSPLSDYVSTVDEGNYLASLVVLLSFLAECTENGEDCRVLSRRVKALLDEGNLRALYRSSCDLFAIGLRGEDGATDDSHYDQYMSEARLTGFLAIARGQVPLRHWKALSRPIIRLGRHLGTASFSGTAFEYFMPRLFLLPPQASFEDEMLHTAAYVQRRAAKNTRYGSLYGVSESAFFASDALSDYPYRAHGIGALALSADARGENVISPYSTFLMLPSLGHEAVLHLARLSRAGLWGPYGFYESAQISSRHVNVVKSYFAHHTGMLILAAANAVFDDVFCRRFAAFEEVRSLLPILSEKIPTEGALVALKKPPLPKPTPEARDGRVGMDGTLGGAVFTAGESRLDVTLEGEVSVFWKKDGLLSLFRPDEGEGGGLVLRALVDGVLYSTRRSENPSGAQLSLARASAGVCITISHRSRRVLFRLRLSGESGVLELSVQVVGRMEEAEVFLEVSPLLKELKEHFAHSAFCALSLSAKQTSRALFVTSRARGGREYALALTDRPRGESGALRIADGEGLAECGGALRVIREGRFPAFRGGVLTNPRLLLGRKLCVFEDCTLLAHTFYLGFDESPSRALGGISRVNEASFCRAGEVTDRALALSRLPSVLEKRALAVTGALLVPSARLVALKTERFSRSELYAFGISGDLPIVFCDVTEERDAESLRFLASLFRYHATSGFRYDLVFFQSRASYQRRGIDAAFSAVDFAQAGYLLSARGGGIFLVEDDLRARELLQSAASFCLPHAGNARVENLTGALLSAPKQTPEFFFEFPPPNGDTGCRFVKEGFLIDRDVSDPVEVFSHLLGSETFGALVTHRSLGHTFETSSRFRRLTKPWDDAYRTHYGERLTIKASDGATHELCECASKVLFTPFSAVYYGAVSGVSYRVTVMAHPTLLFRGVRVELFGEGEADLSYEFDPVLGDEVGTLGAFSSHFSENTLVVSRAVNSVSRPFEAYLFCCGNQAHRSGGAFGLSTRITLNGFSFCEFYLGAKESEKQFEFVRERLLKTPFSCFLEDAKAYISSRLPPPVLETGKGNEAFSRSEFVNLHLPRQALVSRLLTRTGFYQSGGAYGFRDQLQDSLLYLSFDPMRTRRMLLRHASHQFPEGDVLHWWHNLPEGGAHRGVRTRISDDYLWLVYAACRYAEETGDLDVFSLRVPFLRGRPLRDGERDLYDAFAFGEKEPLLNHLLCAVELFLRRGCGAHNLPLMLAGDWNDGFDAFGEGAESVFLAQFGGLCLLRFSELLERLGTHAEESVRYRDAAKKLFCCAENTFNGRWYARAYFGDGEALGADRTLSSPCSIDVLPQAFAAFCSLSDEAFPSEHVLSALEAVWEILFEKEKGVLRLFTPPFEARGRNVGYIRSYASGVRENGGQYTHAAVWYAMACRAVAPRSPDPALWQDRAERVMEALLPYRAATDAKTAKIRRLEPYALAGDVHSSPEHFARAGWTHYTGSAAWAWRYFAEKEKEKPF